MLFRDQLQGLADMKETPEGRTFRPNSPLPTSPRIVSHKHYIPYLLPHYVLPQQSATLWPFLIFPRRPASVTAAPIKSRALAVASSTVAAAAAAATAAATYLYKYSYSTLATQPEVLKSPKPSRFLSALRRRFTSSGYSHPHTVTMPSQTTDTKPHTQSTPSSHYPAPERSSTATPSNSTTEPPSARAAGGWFPLSYKESFSQWWSCVSPEAAEAAVLSFLPFYTPLAPDASQKNSRNTPSQVNSDLYGQRQCSSSMVQLTGKNRAINEFSITRTTEPHTEDLVILHGYGAGLGFFYRNFDAMSRRPGWKLWALDLLGMGRSSRPPFKIRATDKSSKIKEAEDWFIDALEEWRIKRGLDRFTLMGHSLGGYLATAYTLKYPGRVKKLILASPVGVPENPYAEEQQLPANPPQDQSHPPSLEVTGMEAELLQPSDEVLKPTPSLTSTTPPHKPSVDPPRRQIPKWISYLWDQNVSPFTFIRWSGPLGPSLVSSWTSRRFSFLPTPESAALHTYAYTLFRQRGSGEYALTFLLAPGAYARNPLVNRIGKVGWQGVPTVLMYGEVDWMDVTGGFSAQERIRKEGRRLDSQGWRGGGEWLGDGKGIGEDVLNGGGKGKHNVKDGQLGGGEAKVLIVKGAGHHVYLDGWEEFNEMITAEMDDVEERERRRRKWQRENREE